MIVFFFQIESVPSPAEPPPSYVSLENEDVHFFSVNSSVNIETPEHTVPDYTPPLRCHHPPVKETSSWNCCISVFYEVVMIFTGCGIGSESKFLFTFVIPRFRKLLKNAPSFYFAKPL
jgi:hypothetical protein